MKGDFTRTTFDAAKHYHGVRMQQGRVLLDADWNEHQDIADHLDHTTHTDVIGACGAPLHEAGFGITVDGDGLLRIGAGRMYVDGFLCENEAEVGMTEQADLPGYAVPPTGEDDGSGVYLAYLDVWERHVSALEDAALREVALGGPDTTTRMQTVRQVKLLRVADLGADVHCLSDLDAWNTLTAPSTGTLCARAEPTEDTDDPCLVPAQAGFRGLENQTYRVEVHRVGPGNELGLKWSRENGSVVFSWLEQNGDELTLASTGRDDVLGLAPLDWVELTDDDRELRGEAGLLVQVLNVNGLVVTIDPGGETIDRSDFGANPKVRRWDMSDGEIAYTPADPAVYLDLEDGVQVALKPGTFRVGDYWSFPARTAITDVEWPSDDAGDPACVPPHGIAHHYCRLAVLSFDGAAWTVLEDCRTLFPPLTEVAHFAYVGGDGQEAMPGEALAYPLEAAVCIGQTPVEGTRVRFRILDGAGGTLTGGGSSGSDVTVETGPDGIAACAWTPDADLTAPHQSVEATWLDAAGDPRHHPLRYHANLSIASEVAYDAGACLTDAETVAEALDQLCGNLTLHYAGGDGQEVRPLPGNPDTRILAFPIRVRVANGQWPAEGVKVLFSVANDGAELLEEPGFDTDGAPGPEISVVTGPDGLAACRWRLAESPPYQEVKVVLESDGHTATILFHANLSVAAQVAYTPDPQCSLLKGTETVKEALDLLCFNSGGGGAPEPGVTIDRLTLLQDGRILAVDADVFFGDFMAGFQVTCSEDLDPETVRFDPNDPDARRGRATCFVTLEMPFLPPGVTGETILGGFNLMRLPVESASVDGNAIFWKPSGSAMTWLGEEISRLSEILGANVQILARLTLKGNFIWNAKGDLYLDGETLGDQSDTGLVLPSGDGLRGGDFETWFWLTQG
ncbi:DUF6519 domain-containing protein [Rhodocaloribacter sp.]